MSIKYWNLLELDTNLPTTRILLVTWDMGFSRVPYLSLSRGAIVGGGYH